MPRLIFKSDSRFSDVPNKGTYSTEQGQLIYKVDTPFKVSGRTSTIYRSMPTQGGGQQLTKIGEIEYHRWSPTKLRYGDKEMSEHEIFEGKSSSQYATRDRPFTAPDGRRYIWVMGSSNDVRLFLDGQQKILVAQHHHRHLGVAHDNSPISFEVLPNGEHILDFLFLTYLFVENLQEQRKKHTTNKQEL
ncbi:hypothetical protein B0H34DRAFT_671857 [Crassisporium funariophilum]|nr:hypothetical protein B0H34DRAFT_671857 [Crassisporium funariophilum]